MSLIIVAGTRPEAIKLAPVLWNLKREDYVFVWSGQHYDYEMSKIFFEQLGLPEPDVDLDVRSGTHAEQTAKTMIGLERNFNTQAKNRRNTRRHQHDTRCGPSRRKDKYAIHTPRSRNEKLG